MNIYLLAPTEHTLFTLFRNTSESFASSSLPEKHGCDVLAVTANGTFGFQRKTLPDLCASLSDGRLYYELSQINESALIATAFLVIESPLQRTVSGDLVEGNIPLATLRSIIAKFAFNGVGYFNTESTADTLSLVTGVTKYLGKGSASLVKRPKNLRNAWGTVDSNAFGSFLLQSFPGVGPELADRIISHFDGTPIDWTVTAEELTKVPGIGKAKAQQLIASLTPSE